MAPVLSQIIKNDDIVKHNCKQNSDTAKNSNLDATRGELPKNNHPSSDSRRILSIYNEWVGFDMDFYKDLGGIKCWNSSGGVEFMKPVNRLGCLKSDSIQFLLLKSQTKDVKEFLWISRIHYLYMSRNCSVVDYNRSRYSIVTFTGPDGYRNFAAKKFQESEFESIAILKENCPLCLRYNHGNEKCQSCFYCLEDNHFSRGCPYKENNPYATDKASAGLCSNIPGSEDSTRLGYFKKYGHFERETDSEGKLVEQHKHERHKKVTKYIEKLPPYSDVSWPVPGFHPKFTRGRKMSLYAIDVERATSDNRSVGVKIAVVQRYKNGRIQCVYSKFIDHVTDGPMATERSCFKSEAVHQVENINDVSKDILDGISDGILVTCAGRQDLECLGISYTDLVQHNITFIDIQAEILVPGAVKIKPSFEHLLLTYCNKEIRTTDIHSACIVARETMRVFMAMKARIENNTRLAWFDENMEGTNINKLRDD